MSAHPTYDDVRVVAATERTQPAPLPSALRSDGTRPIVLTRGGVGQVRINSDGASLAADWRPGCAGAACRGFRVYTPLVRR
jgi:hypothetical protein